MAKPGSLYTSYKPLIIFLSRSAGIYLAWYAVYNIWLYDNRIIDDFLIRHLIQISSILLRAMGFVILTQMQPALIGITGSSGLIVSPPCDGLSLFVLFAGFIMAYPGNVRSKLLFIPLGILVIDLINIIRIVALTIIVKYRPQWLEFNHSYTFTLIMYTIILGMWVYWIKGTRDEGSGAGSR